MAAEIIFTLTEQDYADTARSQYWHRVKSPKKWVWSIGILAVLFGFLAYLDSYDFGSFLFNLIPYGLLILIIPPLITALTYLWSGRHARRIFRQQSTQPECRMAWDDEGLKVESKLGILDAKWSDFYAWRKARGTYMIHMNEALYYIVPGHALSAPQAADLEKTLARSGVIER